MRPNALSVMSFRLLRSNVVNLVSGAEPLHTPNGSEECVREMAEEAGLERDDCAELKFVQARKEEPVSFHSLGVLL